MQMMCGTKYNTHIEPLWRDATYLQLKIYSNSAHNVAYGYISYALYTTPSDTQIDFS